MSKKPESIETRIARTDPKIVAAVIRTMEQLHPELFNTDFSGAKREAAFLLRKLNDASNITEWRKYVTEHPPTADAIAFLLMAYEKGAQANRERARTARARRAIANKAASGQTMTAQAIQTLEARRRRGDNVMESHVVAQIAQALKCSPRLVRNARTKLLEGK